MRPLLEPILHPSRWRIRALGLSTAIGHPLFYWIWDKWLPQPYESLWQRLTMSTLGAALFIFPSLTASPPTKPATAVFTAIFWVTLPVFFFWMYLRNGGNAVWLASLGAMFLIYYHLTDWRIATVGSVTGLAAGWLLFRLAAPASVSFSGEMLAPHGVVLGFCWYMSLMLGISSSNLRREQLNYTLGTMGIMAHELRTPLATMALIGDAVRNEAQQCPTETGSKLEKLSARLHTIVRNMNRQIDMQISNARLLRLPRHREIVSAAGLVQDAVANYPYRNQRERECVMVRIHSDFRFAASYALFTQVIDNLMKNALRSLAAATTACRPGDLTVEVGAHGNRGRIVVTDKGVCIDDALRARIFQPFFSTDRGTGHGLGLAFCQRVVQGANGSIKVRSARLQSAAFTIELPIVPAHEQQALDAAPGKS